MSQEIRHRTASALRLRLHWVALALALLAAIAGGPRIFALDDHDASWRTIGRNAKNSRNQPSERRITPSNVHKLAPKWVATTAATCPGRRRSSTARCTSGTLRHALET